MKMTTTLFLLLTFQLVFLFLRQTFGLTDSALGKRFGVTGANDLIWERSSSVIENDLSDDRSNSLPNSLGASAHSCTSNSLLSPRTRLTIKRTYTAQDTTEGHSGIYHVFVWGGKGGNFLASNDICIHV